MIISIPDNDLPAIAAVLMHVQLSQDSSTPNYSIKTFLEQISENVAVSEKSIQLQAKVVFKDSEDGQIITFKE